MSILQGNYERLALQCDQYVFLATKIYSNTNVVSGTSCINCFKCSSLNGSNANCEDPFNPAMSSYIEKCMVPKRGHVGMFPANFCTKIIGKNGK